MTDYQIELRDCQCPGLRLSKSACEENQRLVQTPLRLLTIKQKELRLDRILYCNENCRHWNDLTSFKLRRDKPKRRTKPLRVRQMEQKEKIKQMLKEMRAEKET